MLLDVEEVALGYETKLRWNDPVRWVWSDTIAQEPLVTAEQFEAAQTIRSDGSRSRQAVHETHRRVRHPYALRGLLWCGLCHPKVQAQRSNSQLYYRCRYAREYALAAHVEHPFNVYLREREVLPAVDAWLVRAFAPGRVQATIDAMVAAAADSRADEPESDSGLTDQIADCNRRLVAYQAALDAGGDPATIAGWSRAAVGDKNRLLAKRIALQPRKAVTADQLRRMLAELPDIPTIIRTADPAAKALVYSRINLRLAYHPGKHIVRAEARLDSYKYGDYSGVRGSIEPVTPRPFTLTTDLIVSR